MSGTRGLPRCRGFTTIAPSENTDAIVRPQRRPGHRKPLKTRRCTSGACEMFSPPAPPLLTLLVIVPARYIRMAATARSHANGGTPAAMQQAAPACVCIAQKASASTFFMTSEPLRCCLFYSLNHFTVLIRVCEAKAVALRTLVTQLTRALTVCDAACTRKKFHGCCCCNGHECSRWIRSAGGEATHISLSLPI